MIDLDKPFSAFKNINPAYWPGRRGWIRSSPALKAGARGRVVVKKLNDCNLDFNSFETHVDKSFPQTLQAAFP